MTGSAPSIAIIAVMMPAIMTNTGPLTISQTWPYFHHGPEFDSLFRERVFSIFIPFNNQKNIIKKRHKCRFFYCCTTRLIGRIRLIRQAPNISRQHVHLSRRQLTTMLLGLRRHHVHFAIVDHIHHCCFTPTMQPDVVCQVRSAQRLHAFTVCAMTSRADNKLLFTQSGPSSVMWTARQTEHIVGQISHIFLAADRLCLWRHHTHATICDGFMNFVRSSTPQPIAVCKVREAFTSTRIRTMTLGTVILKQIGANSLCWTSLDNLLSTHTAKTRVHWLECLLSRLDFCLICPNLRPFELPRKTAQTWIGKQVKNGEDNGQYKQPHPPPWHGIVQLTQIAIPHVTRGVVFGRLHLLTCRHNQQQ